MLTDRPLLLPTLEMYTPRRGLVADVGAPKWETCVCRLSGNPSDCEDFRRACWTSTLKDSSNRATESLVRCGSMSGTGYSTSTSAAQKLKLLLLARWTSQT